MYTDNYRVNEKDSQVKNSNFFGWIEENRYQIESELHDQAIQFLNSQELPNNSIIPSNLEFNGRWHPLDKAKKCSYIATTGTHSNGVPYLYLTFNSFKHGGFKEIFKSGEVIRQLWESYKSDNRPLTYAPRAPKKRPLSKEQIAKRNALDDAKRIASVERDLKLWESLATQGTSLYLIKKGLTHIEGMRYGKDWKGNFVAMPIQNISGQIIGLQKIYDNGTKKFTYGIKNSNNPDGLKGGFILLGEKLPKEDDKKLILLNNYDVCEGIATGASILLTKQTNTVICALFADNIEPVVKSLRKKYKSKITITIAADNDQWKAHKIHNGKKLGNTGLKKAHSAALKYKCTITHPFSPSLNDTARYLKNFQAKVIHAQDQVYNDFDDEPAKVLGVRPAKLRSLGVPPSLEPRITHHALALSKIKPTDFNDLMLLGGIDAVKQEFSENFTTRPNPNFAFFGEKENDIRKIHGIATGHNKTVINQRYLDAKEIELPNGVTFIRSPIGTGKTRFICESANKKEKILYISHLKSLVGGAVKDFERYANIILSNYMDLDRKNISGQNKLAICLNSLFKMLDENDVLPSYDTVIIDESDQQLRRLCSHLDHKPMVLNILKLLIKRAKRVVLADAHLSKLSVDFIGRIRTGEKFNFIINEWQDEAPALKLYSHETEVVEKARQVLTHDGRIFLAFNGKKQARQAFLKLQKEFPLKEFLYVSADNTGDYKVLEFFKDPNGQQARYAGIIATPSISTGLSIDAINGEAVFDFVGGVFGTKTNTPNDIFQSLGRVRCAKELHIFVDDKEGGYKNKEEIQSAIYDTVQKNLDMCQLDKATGKIIFDPDYEWLLENVRRQQNALMNKFYFNLLRIGYSSGMDISFEDDGLIPEQHKALKKQAKELEVTDYVNRHVNASNISKRKAQELDDKNFKTLDESNALERFWLADFFGLGEREDIIEDDENTYLLSNIDDKQLASFIDKDKRGKLRQQIRALEIGLMSKDEINEYLKRKLKASNKFAQDLRPAQVEHVLYAKVLAGCGLNQDLELKEEDFVYSNDNWNGFVDWVIKQRKILSGIIKVPTDEILKREPLRFVGRVLKLLGLKQDRTKNHKKNEYFINQEWLVQIKDIIETRRSLRSATIATDLAQIEDEGGTYEGGTCDSIYIKEESATHEIETATAQNDGLMPQLGIQLLEKLEDTQENDDPVPVSFIAMLMDTTEQAIMDLASSALKPFVDIFEGEGTLSLAFK
jgi:phage/plasmid primase-like uncharacterized protein